MVSSSRALVCAIVLCCNFLTLTAEAGQSPDASTASISSAVTVLPFRVRDAEFSTALNAIVAVRESANQLTVYYPDTAATYDVNLPAAPTCVGVSPDGRHAAVGYNGFVSDVDLSTRSLLQTLPASSNVIDVIHGGTWVYAFGTDGNVRSVNLSTGVWSTPSYSFRNPAASRLHPAGDRIYGADRNTSPDDIIRFNTSTGPAVLAYDSVYHGDYAMCGNVWIGADGVRLFTACGNTFRASNSADLDIRFAGKLSQEGRITWVANAQTGNIVAVLPAESSYCPSYPCPARADNEIHYYAYDNLLYRGKAVLPTFSSEGKSSPSRGRWLFYNADGTKQYVVVQADSTFGITNDWGVVTVDCAGATVSVTPATATVPGTGGPLSLTVLGSAGCGWSASSSATWMQTSTTGVGDGTVTVNVSTNPTSAPRTGTITVGNAFVSITQSGATAPPPPEPSNVVVSLPFRIVDAEYSASLNAIIAVSDANALQIYQPATRALTSVALDAIPTCVGVSRDGKFAAVGHSGSISYVDLVKGVVVKKLAVSTDVLDIVLPGNGYVYAFPRRDQWQAVRIVNVDTNVETLTSSTIYAGSLARLHPTQPWIFSTDNGLSPSSIEKFDISKATAPVVGTSWASGCINVWFADDGTRMYTACGTIMSSTADPKTDMQYLGKLGNDPAIRWLTDSPALGSIAVLPLYNGPIYTPTSTRSDQEIHYYTRDFFAVQGKFVLPSVKVEDKQWQTRGRWHFVTPDGLKQYVVVQADSESGMLNDFGVVTIDCSSASTTLFHRLMPARRHIAAPISVASAVTVPASGGTVEVMVTDAPGCAWKATPSASWMNTFSAGIGNGTVSISVSANTGAARTGTVTVGTSTLTINQSR